MHLHPHEEHDAEHHLADHADGVAHSHSVEAPVNLPPSFEGSVVLDIGAEVGALVVHTDGALEGRELEVECVTAGCKRTHTSVRARHVDGIVSFAAVYPALDRGRYRLLETGQEFDVLGARVTEVKISA